MKLRVSRFTFILSTSGLLLVSVAVGFLLSRATQDVVVPADFQVERQRISELNGETFGKNIRIANGQLLYEDGTPGYTLKEANLKTLYSKVPWHVNESYTYDGGGDTSLTRLTITINGDIKRIEFDDYPGTQVSKEVLNFNAYLDKLVGH